MRYLLLAGVVVVALAASYLFWLRPEPAPVYTYGPVEAEGVLTGTGLSLLRRGTHLFHTKTGDTYYVESTTYDLRKFDGKRVAIKGTSQPNVSGKFEPLLLPETISLLDTEEGQNLAVPQLGISLSLPSGWNGAFAANKLTVTASGEILLTATTAPLPAGMVPGTPERMAGRTAYRETTSLGSTLSFPMPSSLLVFMLPSLPDSLENEERRAELLATIRFTSSSSRTSSSSLPATPSGSGSVSPAICGGVAGILCPYGSYCAVTNQSDGSGVCKKI